MNFRKYRIDEPTFILNSVSYLNYMPELPEVEVVKQSLEKKITNLTIEKVKIMMEN